MTDPIQVVYDSNGMPVGDGARITRVREKGTIFEVLVDPKEMRWSKLRFAAGEAEPAEPGPTPDPEPTPDPVPDPEPTPVTGRSFYVSANGRDTAAGTESAPFKTFERAKRDAKGGDEIVMLPGTYGEALTLYNGGSAADGDLVLRSKVPGAAKIRNTGWNGISVQANYVTIDGFDISGHKGDGIEANNVHHITILRNICHGNGESGIQFNWSEFITVEDNLTYENASDGWFSGISVYQNRNISGDKTTPGYRTVIRNNVTHDNVTFGGAHTDGNGIIIDDFQSTQTDGFPNYTYPTLVEGNIAYGNGGKGIQVTWSDSVTVSRNTTYANNTDDMNDGTWRGDISVQMSRDVVVENNIGVVDPGLHRDNTAAGDYSDGTANNTIWRGNLFFQIGGGTNKLFRIERGQTPTVANGNLIGVEPQFVDAAGGDFRLKAGSPAAGKGAV